MKAFLFSIVLFLLNSHTVTGQSVSVPSTKKPTILRTIPHDTNAFTQGLFYHQGLLYESTGLYGQSSLRVIDAKDGSIKKNIPVADIFAEGCTNTDSSLVQLSWQEKAAIVYSFPSLKPIGSFSYKGEGWGLTFGQSSYYMSNGSDTLYIRNKNFSVTGKVAVSLAGKQLMFLNELEYVNGLVYANVWFNKCIYVIQPRRGLVIQVVDCADLVAANASASDQDVLNGIAYNGDAGTFFITGKNWRFIFEVKM
jgi:glutamine cyclotransferase